MFFLGGEMILENKVAVVTGGNRGIGKAIALTLAQNGASVAFCDVGTQLGETAAEIEKTGVKALAVTADITQGDQVEAFSKTVLDTFGKVDILVNNAGIARDNLLIRMSEKEWDDVITVNLKGTFLISKVFLKPMMKARSGRIINIASIIGVRGNAGQANYAASKAGIIGLTKTTAREFASRNITCNAIAPGFIQTDMTKALGEKAALELAQQIPLGFLGETSDVANVVLFLASEAARYITGQVICVDGGMVI
jgi:3-oxoacyl-[acyl-carrier protein] reductase